MLFISLVQDLPAQVYKISGKVSDINQQPISYASVQVKELQTGTTTNDEGIFNINVKGGNYEFIFSIVGYKTQSIKLTVSSPANYNIIMEEENLAMDEVQINVTKKDRAEEIIKNVIRQKSKILSEQNFSANVYIKATEENDALSRSIKVLNRPIKKEDELLKMNMAEILIKLDYSHPDKIKETRTGVKLRGNTNNLFFLSTTAGDFNFYKNLVKVPSLSLIPMLSPITYSGLIAYKFKTLNIRKEGERKIYTIRITPTQTGNALVEGEVEIMDSTWTLLTTHFEFPKYHLKDYDNFSVDQQYEFINNKVWMPVRQEFNYRLKTRKTNTRGKTVAVYYDYVTDTTFNRNYFNAEVSATSDAAYNRDSVFWTQARKEILTEKEYRFIQLNDSIYHATHTKAYLDSVDRVYNKLTFSKVVFYGQGIYNRNKERTIILPPLLTVVKPFQLGGVRIAINASYNKIYTSKKQLTVNTDLSYGIRNRDIKGTINVHRLYNPFHWSYYIINVGREFSYIYNNDSWVSAFRRSNIFEKNEISLENGFEITNGFYFRNKIEFAKRNSVENFKFNSKYDTLFRGTITNDRPIAFDPYNALYNTIEFFYTPRQLYIREPKQKINLGSKWPTFYITWRKGISGILNSKIDFDYLEFSVRQKLKLGLAGISDYTFKTGSFINTNKVGIVDYKYMRRGDPFLFTEPTNNFQSLDSTFPVFKRFYEGHYLHSFNGAILNKIPSFKKLNISEVIGGGFLFLPEKDLRYAEAYAGLEKIFQVFNERIKIGGYVVGSVANQFNRPIQLKVALQYYNRTHKRWH
jgi:hypothetical protein